MVAEPERTCVALHAKGAFRAVQNAKGDWRTLLDRERFRVSMEGALPDLVLVAGAEPTPADTHWTRRPPRPSLRPPARAQRRAGHPPRRGR